MAFPQGSQIQGGTLAFFCSGPFPETFTTSGIRTPELTGKQNSLENIETSKHKSSPNVLASPPQWILDNFTDDDLAFFRFTDFFSSVSLLRLPGIPGNVKYRGELWPFFSGQFPKLSDTSGIRTPELTGNRNSLENIETSQQTSSPKFLASPPQWILENLGQIHGYFSG